MASAAAITSPFVSDAPIVRLVSAFEQPFNNAVATARTCYMNRIVSSADVAQSDKAKAQRDAIAQSTYAAGHHTTLQHATFQFTLENVSRQLIWSFLHAHPYYNSEQVSQRYVSVKPNRVLIPRLAPQAQALFEKTVREQMAAYEALVERLTRPVQEAYFDIFPARQKHAEDYKSAVRKKAQEVARYVLPIGTFAHLYHTVSGLTLHRYNRLCNMLDVPEETRCVVAAMIDAVNAHDPLFFRDIEDPIPLEETHEHKVLKAAGRLEVGAQAEHFVDDFDLVLDNSSSRLLDFSARGEQMLAMAVRTTLGMTAADMSDNDAIACVLSPKHNSYLSGALNLTSLGKLSRALQHVSYTFAKKLSHSADSQDQRHRLTPGSRPVLHTQYVPGRVDVVLPKILERTQPAVDLFMEVQKNVWSAIDTLLNDGVSAEMAMYLLPNAFPVRFIESGTLANFHHKWTTRLCYNAQEEIWEASQAEVLQVAAVHPRIGAHLLPPCGLRQEGAQRPLCPEGIRYCGVPVWKKQVHDYARAI